MHEVIACRELNHARHLVGHMLNRVFSGNSLACHVSVGLILDNIASHTDNREKRKCSFG